MVPGGCPVTAQATQQAVFPGECPVGPHRAATQQMHVDRSVHIASACGVPLNHIPSASHHFATPSHFPHMSKWRGGAALASPTHCLHLFGIFNFIHTQVLGCRLAYSICFHVRIYLFSFCTFRKSVLVCLLPACLPRGRWHATWPPCPAVRPPTHPPARLLARPPAGLHTRLKFHKSMIFALSTLQI